MTDQPTHITDRQPTPYAEAEAAFEAASADAAAMSPYVGFVGCVRAGRVLRVRVASPDRMRMRVACPNGCGEHETHKPMVRVLGRDEAAPPLVEIPPDELDRDPGGKGSSRRNVSDAAIFDAIPPGSEVGAREVAEAVGYVGNKPAASLIPRLRRMNERAEKEGVTPPFIITASVGKKPATIRRAEGATA